MTKKKPPPERLRPKIDDAELALTEASKLLGFGGGDPSKLCGADRIRVGMVAGLMAAVDAATESLLAGNSSAGDIGRLTSSVDALVRLLPKAATEPAQSHGPDPREQMWQTYKATRERAAQAGQGYDGLQRENEKLRAEVAALKAGGGIITPTEADVVPPGELGEFFRGPPKPGPDDWRAPPRTPRVIEGTAPQPGPPAEVFGPYPPPGGRFVNGRLCPIPPVVKSGAETKAMADRVNAVPIPRFDTRPANEPWRNFTSIDWRG
jgi:hypothetical protein